MSYPGQRTSGTPVDYLLQGCTTYKTEFRGRITKDVNEVFQQWSSLKVETDVHYSNDGTSQTLIVLNGTVPIFYTGTQYNIPMTFWITKDYPLSPPLVYVTPTSTMQVARNHDYVSPDGTVYLPYLNQWNPSRSNLTGLINTCKSVFSNFPPVHARAPNSTPAPPPQQKAPPAYGQVAQPSPGYPGSTPVASGYPGSTPTASGYPGSTPASPYPTGSSAGYPAGTPPPPAYASAAGSTPYPSSSPPPVAKRSSEDIRREEEEKKASKEKACRQAVAIKLQEKYRTFRESMKVELQQEMNTQKKLEEGQKILEGGICKLDDQKKEFETAINELTAKQAQLESWLEEYGRADTNGDSAVAEMNLDEAIVPADALSRQLFDCVAETSAIDDILYHLDRALSNDAITLDAFLKEVRKLARKQFMAKALAQKIQKHQQKVEMQNRQPPALNTRPPAYQSRYPGQS
mmetsp:Transcript_15351/g.25028  ORF Transcript_15351/g.25028 Transcript_15351/m.25028 type:complete len:460 (-) Transcript_15351:27-1406(-)|eukprot:CAMPEP_0203748474 /NCGR_PEP_ID=MMETSP0098-20131031/3349_1 /ASSEMBLY_ACC=CAM_ASM_000208 /TAXON_ID=96639 /ORGANISM=" , Strain NY0313808BC1" /LENGTH=459 /DNA_ID=CAMNT_0050637231 /DNA_START=455 /DNA_END=1837 /DNA_ORIENTATION=+